MFCANCGNQMAEDNKFCSKCGWRNPMAGSEPVASAQPEPVPVYEVPAAPVAPAQPEPVPVYEAPAAPVAPAQPEPTPTYEGPVQPAQTYTAPVNPVPMNAVPAPKTPAGKKFPVGILVAVLAVVAVLVVGAVVLFNSSSMQNWMKKTFSDPEEYYQWVEGRVIDEAALSAATVYNDYIKENLTIYDMSVSAEASLELEEAGMDMLSLLGMTGIDMSWVESITLEGDVSLKDNMLSFSVAEPDILSAAGIFDFADECVYLQFPDLSDMYLSSDVYETDELVEYLEVVKILYENTPDEKLVEELANKYAKLAVACLDDVDMSETTIRAEGVTQDCVELEVTIDERDVAKIAETVLEALAEDEDVKKWMIESLEALSDSDINMGMYTSPENYYKEFAEAMEYAAKEAKYLTGEDIELVMTVYVDAKGNVCGRSFEYEDVTVETLMVHDGSDFGYSCVATSAYGETVALVGKGKDSGGKLTGEFAFEYNGMAIVNVAVDGLDINKLKKGQLKGTFTVSPSSALVRAMDMASYSSVVGKLSVTIEADCNAGEAKLICSVYQADEKWGALTLAVQKGKGEKAKLPSSKKVIVMESDEDLLDWVATVNWKAYIKKLEKANLPSDIINAIEMISEMNGDDLMDMLYYLY